MSLEFEDNIDVDLRLDPTKPPAKVISMGWPDIDCFGILYENCLSVFTLDKNKVIQVYFSASKDKKFCPVIDHQGNKTKLILFSDQNDTDCKKLECFDLSQLIAKCDPMFLPKDEIEEETMNLMDLVGLHKQNHFAGLRKQNNCLFETTLKLFSKNLLSVLETSENCYLASFIDEDFLRTEVKLSKDVES